MLHQISVATRGRKNEPYTEEGAIERWVAEYAEAHEMSTEEVENLAIIKLENERIRGRNVRKNQEND